LAVVNTFFYDIILNSLYVLALEQVMVKDLSILYVEDEALTRMMMKKQLESEFAVFLEAENGEVGLEKFKTMRPDVVITDISMPVMNGYEMIKYIKVLNEDAKIIVTSAHTDHGDKLDGCTIVNKPIIVNNLIKVINEMFV